MVPLLMAGLLGCKSIDEIQNELKATGEPVITSLVPSSAKVGDTVTIRGLNFTTTPGKVGFEDASGNINVADISGWADDFVVVKVPTIPGNPETAKVHMQTADSKRVALNPTFTLKK